MNKDTVGVAIVFAMITIVIIVEFTGRNKDKER
jgi:hypothetical protein